MDPLKVLQLHNRYREAGGEDTVLRMERDLLRQNGHEVREFGLENPEGAGALGSFLVSAWNPASAKRVEEMLETERPDVAHIHNTWWALTPSIIRPLKAAGIPIVVTLHNYRLLCVNAMLFRDGRPCEACVGTHPWRGVRHRCYRDSLLASTVAANAIAVARRSGVWQEVDRFLALTEFARQRFISGGLSPEKMAIKSNFVDDPGPRFAPPSESKTILFVGRLSHEKGVRPLLEAWSDADLRGFELLIIGSGPLRSEIESTAPNGVRFAGRVPPDRVAAFMLRARGMVLPSLWYEGQPMVLLEALAAGLPLVVSDIGGIPETVAGCAELATPGDHVSWSRALQRFADPGWVDDASVASRAVYQARYASDVALRELVGSYRSVIRDD